MFRQIVVIGSGTMGAGIAAQIANAGHEVLLLDLPGDTTDRSASPDAVVEGALSRLQGSNPPQLMHDSVLGRIKIGNVRDDLTRLAEADWVVEAIIERLPEKRALYRELEAVIPPHCVVTSNTSTIPIRLLVEDCTPDFQRRFAITHYFNPVRYMRLLELVGGEHTEPAVLDRLAEFNDRELGKGVVRCADTPGFLANRVGVFALQVGIDEALRGDLPIEVADALMGRPMGIPKTGVFGLYDLIGIDLMADVVDSLASILPEGDPFHAVAGEQTLIRAMIDEGMTGNKGGGGFYRRDADGARLARRLPESNYTAVSAGLPALAKRAAERIAAGREPLRCLLEANGAEGEFAQCVLARVLAYAAGLLGEVTDSPQSIDDAMKLGFNWQRGPFEMIDAIGVERVVELFESRALVVPPAVADGRPFYRVREGTLEVRHVDGDYRAIDLPDGANRFHLQRRTLVPLLENSAASLYAIEDDLRLIEFHSKANALTDESMRVVARATADTGRGILVHNDALHYSAGVDLNVFLQMIDAEDWTGMEAFLERFQQAVLDLKYCPVPVVGAPSGLSLGGGMEVLLHCDELVLHANSVTGLVESAVGLLPAGGGIKETWLRWYRQLGDWEAAAWKSWMNIGYGRTASSPQHAERLAYFRPGKDHSVMNRDRLYRTAVDRLSSWSDYRAPAPPEFQLMGGELYERMQAYMSEGVADGRFTDQNRDVALAVGRVFCADDGVTRTVDEAEVMRRERANFVALAQLPDTRTSIATLLGVH